MANIIRAVDVSSNNPNRSQETVDLWVANGCQLLLIKAYSLAEPVALQQSTREWREYAANAGLWRQPYTWLYNSVSPTNIVTTSAMLWEGIDGPAQLIMLDAENYVNQDGLIDTGPTVDQILEAAYVCRSRRAVPLLYTANWWLNELAKREDVSRLRGMLAVLADYSTWPSVNIAPNDYLHNPYGLNVIGHQYTSEPQDWSVFDLDALTAAILAAQSPEVPVEPYPPITPPDWPQEAIQELSELRADLVKARSDLGVLTVDYAGNLAAIGKRIVAARRKADRQAILNDLENVVLAMRSLKPSV
jgi:hypothetical protein